jgi:hypothetical protein
MNIMQKISFYPSIFLAEEINSMAKQIITTINTSKSNDEILLKAKAALETSNERLTRVINAILSNPYTQKLAGADNWRDSVYVGGRNTIEACTHWVFDMPKKEAADRLLEVINRHGWSLHTLGYQKQSSAMNSLLAEYKKEGFQTDLATLSLTVWYNEQVKAQENFESIFNQKANSQNSKESVEKKDAQVPVSEDIEKLITYLNSIIMFNNGNEIWNRIYNEVDGVVKQMTTVARARRSNQSKINPDKETDKTK